MRRAPSQQRRSCRPDSTARRRRREQDLGDPAGALPARRSSTQASRRAEDRHLHQSGQSRRQKKTAAEEAPRPLLPRQKHSDGRDQMRSFTTPLGTRRPASQASESMVSRPRRAALPPTRSSTRIVPARDPRARPDRHGGAARLKARSDKPPKNSSKPGSGGDGRRPAARARHSRRQFFVVTAQTKE